jgi:hypothetical protein
MHFGHRPEVGTRKGVAEGARGLPRAPAPLRPYLL